MIQGNDILEIFCSSCGSPAVFDIAAQNYRCAHCGSVTGISEALEGKKEYRSLIRKRLKDSAPSFAVKEASCTGCGARVIFPENEALAVCAFCGRKLVRKAYIGTDDFPELLIPFRITQEDAKRRLLDWCAANGRRSEAKAIKANIDSLEGFYLPYMIAKGPDSCGVRREHTKRTYHCRGYIDRMFVNTSSNLDNSVLDGTEPYDTADLREFDFAYLAGQRVKIADLNGSEAAGRVRDELASDYEPFIRKTLQSSEITITPDINGMVTMSAVLPAYYLKAGDTVAAVNGQTGKVAVRENRERFTLPWQIRAAIALVSLIALTFTGFYFGTRDLTQTLFYTGILGIFFLIVILTAYHDHYGGSGRFRLRRRILTSDKSRPDIKPPVFYENIRGEDRPVRLKFSTPLRIVRNAVLCTVVTFLPIVIAFVLNGFSAKGLTVGGAAVWLCVFVPVSPVYFIKFGHMHLHERPHIYVQNKRGRFRRYRHFPSLAGIPGSIKRSLSPGAVIAVIVVFIVLLINVKLVLDWDSVGTPDTPEPASITGANGLSDTQEAETDLTEKGLFGRTKYRVDYGGQKEWFRNAKDYYYPGEKVKVYYDMIATDTDYSFTLEGDELRQDYDHKNGFKLTFTMPDHDVKLTVSSRNSMVRF